MILLKSGKLLIFKVLNLILVVTCLGLSIFYSIDAKKYIDRNVLYLTPRISRTSDYFSYEDTEKLRNSIRGNLSPEKTGKVMVKGTLTEAYSEAVYISEGYFDMNRLEFLYGSPAHGRDSVVINESLAWYLSGHVDMTGQAVTVSDREYIVSCVVKQGKVSKENLCLWIMNWDLEKTEEISNLYIQPYEYSILSSTAETQELLKSAGKRPENYYITDMNLYTNNILLKYQVLFFMCGILVIMFILRQNSKRIINGHLVYRAAAGLLTVGTVAVILWFIRFEFWTPNQLPLLQKISAALINGYLPYKDYLSGSILRLWEINRNGNLILAGGTVGLINLFFLET